MKVLVVGGGGREHALAWGIGRSPRVTEVHAAPGNAGIAEVATCHDVGAEDLDGLVSLAIGLAPALVVIGPEAPLVGGLADRLRAEGLTVFGPDAAAARLEGSKAWAKEVMAAGEIPTARAEVFAELTSAVGFVDELGGRAVVKADGLAAGKGVTVATDRQTAIAALRDCLEGGAFGPAGETVVVEELLEGREVSAFALVDGTSILPLGLSQDFKRVSDGDVGPNTGGMGAYSPIRFVDAVTERDIWDRIVAGTVRTLRGLGIGYRGLLYTGLMLTEGGPKVLEFNVRFGDPETEAVIPRLSTDLADLLEACASDRLADVKVVDGGEAAVTVVAASGGYPGAYRTGLPIHGLDEAAEIEGVTVFHAGTRRDPESSRVLTAGGRVLSVTGVAPTIAEARDRAYRALDRIGFEGMTVRRDIAARAAEEESP